MGQDLDGDGAPDAGASFCGSITRFPIVPGSAVFVSTELSPDLGPPGFPVIQCFGGGTSGTFTFRFS